MMDVQQYGAAGQRPNGAIVIRYGLVHIRTCGRVICQLLIAHTRELSFCFKAINLGAKKRFCLLSMIN